MDHLDAVTRLAKSCFGVDVSVLCLRAGGQWRVVSMAGGALCDLLADDLSFAATADGVAVIPDVGQCLEFATLPWFKSSGALRFFASAALRSDDGEVAGLLIIMDSQVRDLDEGQRRMLLDLAELARSKLIPAHVDPLLQAVSNNVTDGIVITDATGKIISVNPSVSLMFGYEPFELLGQRPNILMPEQERQQHDIHMANHRFTRSTRRMGRGRQLKGVTKDGRIFPIEVKLAEVEQDGNLQFIAIIRDITRRKQDEHELERSRTLLRRIVDGSPACVFVIDADHRVTHWNRASELILGGLSMEMIGTRDQWKPFYSQSRNILADLVMEDNAAQLIAERYGDLVHPTPQIAGGWHGIDYFPHLQGGARWLYFTALPLRDDEGRICGAVETLVDISDQKRYEEELIQANRAAQAANVAKSQFLATVSHEIRTPLNAIIGLSGQLSRRSNSEQDVKTLGTILGAGKHLLTLINEVLDLSKIEAGKLEINWADFNLRELVTETASEIRPGAQEKGLSVLVEMADTIPDILRGDAQRIRQCLLNYLSNAVKFTEQGKIVLRVKGGPVEAPILFEVEDSGIGVSEDAQKRLFSDFVQADGSISRKYGGTGLGLAITRKLARLMGGDAGFTSLSGQGSLFWFDMILQNSRAPVHGGIVDVEEAERRLADQYTAARILLVEDNLVNQQVVLGMLEDVGLSADVACNGCEALEALAVRAYDLVLMDLQMPVMDGLTAAAAIRHMPDQWHLPIVAMTANAFAEDRQKCLDVGMNDHLGKPILPEQFYTMLLRWLPSP